MQTLSMWENIILAVLVLSVIFWFRPGLKASLEHSRHAEKHWRALLTPLGVVVLFVVFLIMIV
ncbi:MAG: hypothetical protein ACU837_02195 [Gammaproteobacteria bacterium]